MDKSGVAVELPRAGVEALTRSNVYSLLARAFFRPDLELAGRMDQGVLVAELNRCLEFLPRSESLAREAAALGRALRQGSDQGRPTALTLEYVRLFSHGRSATCLPYETEYTTPDALYKAHQLADIAGFYRAFGLEMSTENRERPDHLAAELEFMHFLALKEAQAMGNGYQEGAEVCVDAQMKFLRDHLGRWLHAFHEEVRRNDGHPIYQALARLAARYVSWDARRLRARPRRIRRRALLRPVGEAADGGCELEPAGCPVQPALG